MKLFQKKWLSTFTILIIALSLSNSVFASPPSSTYIAATNTEKLQSALNQHGWRTYLDADGSLYVFLQTAKKPPVKQAALSGYNYFSKSLTGTNWSIEQDKSGNIFLTPEKNKKGWGTHIPAARQHSEIKSAHVKPLKSLAMKLKETGWNSYLDQTGDLILSFAMKQIITASTHKKGNIDSLDRHLEKNGWISHRDKSGSLIITHPRIST